MAPVHIVGIVLLVAIFIIGTTRHVNLGVLAVVATFAVGTFVVKEPVREIYSGFPVDLFVLLVGVTYLFGVAVRNGTVAWLVDAAVDAAGARPLLIEAVVFVVAALPTMAGALGSSGVALLAPLAMRVAERCAIDRRLMGLLVVHGAAAGNFSPLNVLGAIVHQTAAARGIGFSTGALFWANLAVNVAVAMLLAWLFRAPAPYRPATTDAPPRAEPRLRVVHVVTIGALVLVAGASLGFNLPIGFVAFAAGASLQLLFPRQSAGAEREVAWGVVLLVCGVLMYVTALQRYGTVTAVGEQISAMGQPLAVAFLLCVVAAVTSAFASSAAILGAIIPLAAPALLRGSIAPTGFIIALALSTTLVDAAPFSTVGALAVANASEDERRHVYGGLLAWGATMVAAAPVLTWLMFVLPAAR